MSALDKIKATFEERPVEVIAVGAMAATAVGSVLRALTQANNSRTWRKEVNRRVKAAKKAS